MEVADADFVRGMRYLAAARRCERWCGDDVTESRLKRLGVEYRFRAMDLMKGLETGALSTPASPATLDGQDADGVDRRYGLG